MRRRTAGRRARAEPAASTSPPSPEDRSPRPTGSGLAFAHRRVGLQDLTPRSGPSPRRRADIASEQAQVRRRVRGGASMAPSYSHRLRVLRSPRWRTIARQAGSGLLTLFLISVVAFGMMSVRSPSEVAHAKFGNQITQVQIDAFSHKYGLDKPVYERYGKWLWHFAHGDMGTSYVTDVSVSSNVLPRFERTLILSLVSLLIAMPISVLIGIFQARRLGSLADLSLLSGSVVIAALPEFVVGIGLLFLFAVELGWLPTARATALTFASSFADEPKAYVLPAATIALAIVPSVARIARGSLPEARRL